ncbi:MAG TPA: hypothetical protein VNL71_09735 [Chloroflexota bacterium]|nr:hypothetical protein [Chloroflexota bacterium]
MRMKAFLSLPCRVAAVASFVLLAGIAPRFAATSTSRAAQASRPSTPDPRFGVVEAWRAPTAASQIGVGWERLTFWWKNIQPDGPNSYNLWATDRDHQINHEIATGRQLVGLLINTPDWAALNPAQHGDSIPKGLYLPYNDPNNYWGHFVKLIAAHYKGRINDWILWNEVSIPNGKWCTWHGSVADYAQLVRVADQAAKAVNPEAKIILSGDPYWYDHGAFFTTLMQDLSRGPQAVANHYYFDAANLHLYSRPSDYRTIITLYNQIMARYGIQKPMWLSETNALPYNDPIRRYARSGFFGTMQDQASYIIEAFSLALALNVQHIEVNRMVDGTDFTAGGEPFGLIRNNHTVRPEYYAYSAATSLYAGVTDGTISYDKQHEVYVVTLHKPGATLYVTWNQSPIPQRVSIPALARSAIAYDKFGSGNVVSASDGTYRFTLTPSTDNTDPADPKDYVIGGSPIVLVQSN